MNNEKPANHSDLADLLETYESFLRGSQHAQFREEEFMRIVDFYDEDLLPELALEAADLALSFYPFALDFHLKKASILLDNGMEELSLIVLEEAAHIAPGDLEIALLKIQALTALELFQEATNQLNELRDKEWDHAEMSNIFYTEALIYEWQEQYENMFFALKASLWEDPGNQAALERIWLCTELSKMYQESIRFHEELLEVNAYSARAWYNLGHAYEYYGQYAEAIQAFEYAYLIDNKFEFAYRDCGELCFELRHYAKALNCFAEMLNHFEPDTDVLLRIGQCYQAQGNFALSKIFYEKAILLDSLNDEVFYQLGLCFLEEGNTSKAIRYFEKAIRLDDRREEYAASMAEALVAQGDFEKAEPWFEMAAEIAPETTEYWIRYARFLIEIGHQEAALGVLDEAEEYAVGTELLYCRIIALLEIGRRQEALILLGSALDEDYNKHRALFELKPELVEDREIQAVIATFLPYQN
jgi:tetratricopeptide (TPR) repeat protein